jgi:hypothetical protein
MTEAEIGEEIVRLEQEYAELLESGAPVSELSSVWVLIRHYRLLLKERAL